MNSNTQYLVKLMLVDSAVRGLLENRYIPEAHATLLWMQDEITRVQGEVLDQAGTEKQKVSWLRVGDAALHHIYSLREELPPGEHAPEPGSDLYLASVMTHILDDMAAAKGKRQLIEPLLDAAYSVELMVEYKQADDHRACANEFVESIYGKMGEVA